MNPVVAVPAKKGHGMTVSVRLQPFLSATRWIWWPCSGFACTGRGLCLSSSLSLPSATWALLSPQVRSASGQPLSSSSVSATATPVHFAEKLGKGPLSSVSSHLIVLHPLGCANDRGILDLFGQILLEGLGPFFDQTVHAKALFAGWLLLQLFEDLFQTRHVLRGLA